ncbi:hypothetical protein [Paraburkholderia graminis]
MCHFSLSPPSSSTSDFRFLTRGSESYDDTGENPNLTNDSPTEGAATFSSTHVKGDAVRQYHAVERFFEAAALYDAAAASPV